MRIRPVGGDGRIIVKRDPWPTQFGGVQLPPTAVGRARSTGRKLCTRGTVLAVHEGCALVKVGDRVVFWEMSGTDRYVDGEEVTIMPQAELLAVEVVEELMVHRDTLDVHLRIDDGDPLYTSYLGMFPKPADWI